jgi:D-alanyl-D-alanine carboxypeptidase (penicillin-binding protein 5/6)
VNHKTVSSLRFLASLVLALLLAGICFSGRAAAETPGGDRLLTGTIEGQPFVFDLDSLQSRTACLLLFDQGERVDLLHYRQTEKVYVASLTKLMTGYLAWQLMEEKGATLDSQVTVRAADLEGLAELNASLAGFQDGESVSYRDLFYGLLISSGCDAANTLARATTGSVASFVMLMNQEADRLGLSRTRFANPTGLFDPDNYSTAEDMAVLLGLLLDQPFLKQALSERTYRSQSTSQHPGGVPMRHYLSYYGEIAGIDSSSIEGGKTGQLKESGYCLASFKTIGSLTAVLCTTGADQASGHLSDHLVIYQALEEQLPQGSVALRGIGQSSPLPTSPPTSRPQEQEATTETDQTGGGITPVITAVFFGLVVLLALFALVAFLIKRRLEKEL